MSRKNSQKKENFINFVYAFCRKRQKTPYINTMQNNVEIIQINISGEDKPGEVMPGLYSPEMFIQINI